MDVDKRMSGARQLRPNSLMAMMLPEREARQGKRSAGVNPLRPNSFLVNEQNTLSYCYAYLDMIPF
jgi:hypothetical protein